jgi:hypothetical protein
MWIGFRHDDTQSHAEAYAEAGVPLAKANNARRYVQNNMRDMLEINHATGRPHWALTADCVNAIRTIPTLVASDLDPEIIDDDSEDHAAAAICYGLAAKPSSVYQHQGAGIVVLQDASQIDPWGLPMMHDSRDVLAPAGLRL